MKLTYEDSLKHFTTTFKKSHDMGEKTKNYIPGGFSRKTFNYGPHAIFVDKAEGAYIHTIDGKKLLDLNNNFTVSIFGYQNKVIDQAIIDTMKKGYSIGNPTEEEGELAKMLSERVPSMEKVKFFCSASEAALGALRTARAYTGKTKYAKMEGGYHGFLDEYAWSAHPDPNGNPGEIEHINPQPDSGGVPQERANEVVVITQNNIEVTEKILRDNAKDLACVILELQAGAGGVIVLEKEYVKRIREITKELGILLIFDETMSIRSGRGGLQGQYEVYPDLTVTGKTIGGGLPLGAIGGATEVMQVYEDNRAGISGTHHGHRLACAAGIACLTQLTDDVYAHINGLGERLIKEVNAWSEEKNYPFHMYGKNSILAYAFTKEPGQRINTARDFWRYSDGDKMQTYALEVAVKGFFPVHRGQLAMSVPMTDDDITSYIETTKEIVTDICG